MDNQKRKEIAKEVLENMAVTKEEYEQIKMLCEEFDLEIRRPVPEDSSWDEILNEEK